MNSPPSDGTRTSKKRRASQEPETDLQADKQVLLRSSTFWLDDGNVVLETPTKQFRVHKSVLKMHSTFFEDLFTLAHPDDQPSVDGCPTVAVTDSAVDWHTLLTLLYHREGMYINNTNVIPIVCLLPMLRLGRKYGSDRFKAEALRQIHVMYPRTLKGLDDILDRELGALNSSTEQLQLVTAGEEFKMLRAMLELGIETALPVLYYLCVRDRSLDEIFVGRDTYRPPGCPEDDTVYLSKEAQFSLASGKEKLVKRFPTTTFSWWHKGKPSALCTNPGVCKKQAHSVIRSLTKENGPSVAAALDPLDHESGLCKECDKEARASHTAGRQLLFDALPSFFGLPAWDQLKEF